MLAKGRRRVFILGVIMQVSDKKAIYEVIKSISGQNNILTIPRIYIDLCGNVKSALFLSQCVYWADKMGRRFYKTYADWQEEIGLTERELDAARKDCSAWVKTEVHRANGFPTLHYYVNMDTLIDALSTLCTKRKGQNVLNEKDKTYLTLTETTTETTTDIDKLQNNLQKPPTGKNGDSMNTEEYKKQVELSTAIGMSHNGYAHFPERIRPVVEKMEEAWNFKPPMRKGKQVGFWIQSCDSILEACGEYGMSLLDELRQTWEEGLNTHNGLAPYPINGPQSLVNAVQGFAASKRRGERYIFNYPREYKPEHRSLLDF
jgi:hypothetical protein